MSTAVRVAPGSFRGVYLWAGNATIDLNRTKFPDHDVDEDEHLRAHTSIVAEELARLGFNAAFLSMNWGFPPERERDHWAEFEEAAANYHAAGLRVVGYVQASNCLAAGSYADRDWYAVTPSGRRVPYFLNRLMTCWNHEDWVEEVGRHAERAIELGADGVFFDNLWMGAVPWAVAGHVGGFAGCACQRCRDAFADSAGLSLPVRLGDDAATRRYLDWRAGVVTKRLAGWTDRVRCLRPDAIVLANNCDAVLRDTRALFGLDPGHLAGIQDGVLVENVATAQYHHRPPVLSSNAIPVRALRAIVPAAPILTVTYEKGIGLDGPPAPLTVRRTIAEAAALGVSPVLKGTEYLDSRRRFTVFTSPEFDDMRRSAGRLFGWIDANRRLFEDAIPRPDVAILLDTEGLRDRHGATAAVTWSLATLLLHESVCFGFTTADAVASGAFAGTRVLVPAGVAPPATPRGAEVVAVPAGAHDVRGRPVALLRDGAIRGAADRVLSALSRAYFGSATSRRVIDRIGLTRRFLRSAYFAVPRKRASWNGLVPDWLPTRVVSPSPVLVERLERSDGATVIHLVNFSDSPTVVRMPGVVSREPGLHTPDGGTSMVRSGGLEIRLEQWAVLELPG
jgi:hypothetical protein